MPTKKSVPMYRQGDVLVVEIKALPDGLTAIDPKSDSRGLVLAEGEVAGHCHAIAWDSIGFAGSDGASLYFSANDGAALNHQEHSTITLPDGLYQVIHQREYSPEEIRRVAD